MQGSDPEFDQVIGRLDFILSKLMLYRKDAEASSLSDANRQTLKHHAEDMIAAGNAILNTLNPASGSGLPPSRYASDLFGLDPDHASSSEECEEEECEELAVKHPPTSPPPGEETIPTTFNYLRQQMNYLRQRMNYLRQRMDGIDKKVSDLFDAVYAPTSRVKP